MKVSRWPVLKDRRSRSRCCLVKTICICELYLFCDCQEASRKKIRVEITVKLRRMGASVSNGRRGKGEDRIGAKSGVLLGK